MPPEVKDPPRLNRSGNGKGMRNVTKPQPTKRGQNAAKMPETIEYLREHALDQSTHQVAEISNPDRPLTTKQLAFVKAWASGDSILAATVRAGYNDGGTFGYRLARMPHILKIYEAEKAAYVEASQMTRKKVMDGLLEGIEMARLLAEPSSMIAGWREIGKLCGFYEPIQKRIDVNLTGNLVLDRLNRLSDAELLKLIQDGVKEEVKAIDEAENEEEE
jgi:phage terminase small subunit